MKLTVLSKSDFETKFEIQGINTSLASAMRRVMMSEIPTMAIEWVDFRKNDSAVTDEVVANRLGMVPLTFDQKVYNLPDQCKCEGKGCSLCQVKLVLKKKGPGVVYAGDMKSTAKDVKPLYDNIPVTELFDENSEVTLEATAQLGTGRRHVKWQGAVVGYKQDEKSKDTFTFNVESVCGLKVGDVIGSSLKILEHKFTEFSKAAGKL
jgi:DNA-directed RNA polymerase subunit D